MGRLRGKGKGGKGKLGGGNWGREELRGELGIGKYF